ncbi:hypothetical protein [Paraburkholderia sp.]|uniref:hypothetical protein n=1 Tax=Paraburkholderia sp. TaxID=1926495 RepID=UPI002383FE80|nr:hypothetical protein [Paraburkholderia sp.]MDE1179486.1 hypothetical protein [Paraburkholderia sp.]
MNALSLLDSLEADIQRVRNLDPALKSSMINRLDELRAMHPERKPVIDIYSRDECVYNYCAAPSICKNSDRCQHG